MSVCAHVYICKISTYIYIYTYEYTHLMRLASEGAGSLHRKEGVSSGSGVVPVGFQHIGIRAWGLWS